MRRFALGALGLAALTTPAQAQTDAEIKQMIIRDSIAAYPGPGPCPYSRDRAGRSYGRRSAYSRPGGYAPICYPSDISAAEVEAYRQRLRQR